MIFDWQALLSFVASFLSLIVVLTLILVGVRSQPGEKNFTEALRGLAKTPVGSKIGGVCAGLGKYTAIPTWMWRFIFLMLLFFFGGGLLIYVSCGYHFQRNGLRVKTPNRRVQTNALRRR